MSEKKNKWCPGCETSYPKETFHSNQGYCPTCKHKYDVERRRKIKVTKYDKFKRWQQHLKKRYKFTLLDVESLYLSQNGVCAICAKGLENPALEETVRFSMSIDHDHNCCPSETLMIAFLKSETSEFFRRKPVIPLSTME